MGKYESLHRGRAAATRVYDYTIVDRIFDAYRDAGVRPYLQLGFMPEAMSTSSRSPTSITGTPSHEIRRDLHRLGLPAQRFYAKFGEELCFQWSRSIASNGTARTKSNRLVLRDLERAQRRLLERERAKSSSNCTTSRSTASVERCPTARVGGPDTAGDGGEFADAVSHARP